jgi:hypothetical protein
MMRDAMLALVIVVLLALAIVVTLDRSSTEPGRTSVTTGRMSAVETRWIPKRAFADAIDGMTGVEVDRVVDGRWTGKARFAEGQRAR